MSSEPPIIIIKKKGGHAGHHGGAWKVAYADFVTAMMALFIVLWLLSSTSKKTQVEIAGYFNDPKGTSTKHGATTHGKEDSVPVRRLDMSALKEQLLRKIEQNPDLKKLKGQIELTITDEGLRIELMEDSKGTFYQSGSAQPTPILVELLKLLSTQLAGLPNKISVEGHTDAQPYSSSSEAKYGNWELSSDRANMARRLMQSNGIGAQQVSQVRGFADQRLRKPASPLDPSNRRISMIVQNLEPDSKGPPLPAAASPTAKPKPATASPAQDPAALPPAAPHPGAP